MAYTDALTFSPAATAILCWAKPSLLNSFINWLPSTAVGFRTSVGPPGLKLLLATKAPLKHSHPGIPVEDVPPSAIVVQSTLPADASGISKLELIRSFAPLLVARAKSNAKPLLLLPDTGSSASKVTCSDLSPSRGTTTPVATSVVTVSLPPRSAELVMFEYKSGSMLVSE